MAERTFSDPAEVTAVLSQLSEAAMSTITVRRGKSDDERIVTVDAEHADELAAADTATVAPSAEAVRTEAARRLIAAFGARDRDHVERLISDATREAVKLLRVGEANWTAEQAARAAQLEQSEAYVDEIDTASKALRAMRPIPTDYANDKHWPVIG